MNLLKGDFHIHSKYSIEPKFMRTFEVRSIRSPKKIIDTAIKRGLNTIAMTDHDTMDGCIVGERYIKKKGIEDFTFIKGEEVSTEKGHLVGLGLQEAIKPGLSPQETMDKIIEQGGIGIAPHHYTPMGLRENIKNLKGLTGIEVFNPHLWIASTLKYITGFYKKFAQENNLTGLSCSDAHTLGIIGKVFTELRCEHGVDNILRAIKQNKINKLKQLSLPNSLYYLAKDLSLVSVFWRPQAVLVEK